MIQLPAFNRNFDYAGVLEAFEGEKASHSWLVLVSATRQRKFFRDVLVNYFFLLSFAFYDFLVMTPSVFLV